MDLLRRDWERALDRHSQRHPVTYNGSLWTTTSQARRKVDGLNENTGSKLKKIGFLEKPLREKRQVLKITKVYEQHPNHKTIYCLNKTTSFYPNPYEHLISHNAYPQRRPATTQYKSVNHLLPHTSNSSPVVNVNYPTTPRQFSYPSPPALYAPNVWTPRSGTSSYGGSLRSPSTDHEVIVCS